MQPARQPLISKRFNPYRVFWFAATGKTSSNTIINSLFQSLSGFLVRCNPEPQRRIPTPSIQVSIPIGFSGSLQHYMVIASLENSHGFNPYRVFWFAATRLLCFNCNFAIGVSIPIGFSGSLQLPYSALPLHIYRFVSIPIGFSGSLQR